MINASLRLNDIDKGMELQFPLSPRSSEKLVAAWWQSDDLECFSILSYNQCTLLQGMMYECIEAVGKVGCY